MAIATRLGRGGLVAATVAAAIAPGIALAATQPIKKGEYVSHVLSLFVSSTGKSMKVQSSGYCHKWSVNNVAVNHGKFSFSGSATNGRHAVLSGSFVTSHKATGVVKVGSCAKKAFTARFIGLY